jgi:hypothetical protein
MENMPSFEEMRKYGYDFGPLAMDWITAKNVNQLAMDAGLITSANSTVPVELSTYFDPMVIDILTGARKAREIYSEVKKGDWTTPVIKFRTQEVAGKTDPYGDFANTGRATVNYNWVSREPYLFQTVISYGDLEEATTSLAKINLAADKQRAAANIIDIDANRFYMYGVSGLKNYGLLNDPSLTATITPLTKAAGGVLWSVATTVEIYNDVLATFARLVTQMDGLVDASTPLKLALPPALAVELGRATDFNISALDMLKKYFTSLTIVTAPEYFATATGNTMQLIATNVLGMATGELGYNVKVRAGRIIPDLSSFKQKWTSGTEGALIYRPAAIAQMRGM